MTSIDDRRTSVDRKSVETILSLGGEYGSTAQAVPAERIGLSPHLPSSAMLPPPRPAEQQTRPLSFAARNGNRLSLSFPVQPSISGSSKATPTSSDPANNSFPTTPAEQPITLPPNDPNSFLVALAAQERKVLELKEEVRRAEEDLDVLKRQWAVHEGNRKRAEIRHVEQLQPVHGLSGFDKSGSESDDNTSRRTIELNRRNTLLAKVSKDSRRKIITGGHTRTLSLLSPDKSTYNQQFLSQTPGPENSDQNNSSNNGLPRSSTMPDTSQGLTKIKSNKSRHSYQGSIGVKQIAEDLKSGLFTFMEDLRQATVGDEAISATTHRAGSDVTPRRVVKKSSRSSMSGKLHASKEQSGPGPGHRGKQKTGAGTIPSQPIMDELNDDDWDNWDSPGAKADSPRWSGSTVISSASTAPPTIIPGGTRAIPRTVLILLFRLSILLQSVMRYLGQH